MFIIAAVDRNGAIGKSNELPWRSREDLKLFKKMTAGRIVVMGRKTADSLRSPLPNRFNIVLSSEPSHAPAGFCHMKSMVDVANLSLYTRLEVAVIGGAEIYRLALPYANRVFITHLDIEVTGADTFFPLDEMHKGMVSLETLVVQEETETTPAFKQIVYGDKEWIE